MQTTLPQTDSELIQASRSGDKAAFGQLVTRYQSLVCSVAYNRCGDLASSEDLAQEAFIQAWKKLGDLQELASFKSWLCTIVRNLANRTHSRQSGKPAANAASLDSVADVAETSESPVAKVMSAEQQQLVWSALAEIPENYREPMILFYREEQSVSRVAEALDLSTDAVKQRLARGRKMLHAQMVATVEETLSSTKPSDNFASTVMLGLGGGGKATLVGAAAKATSLFSGGSGIFWLSLAQLPVAAWLAQMAIKEARSEVERALVIRHLVILFLGMLPFIGISILYIYLQPDVPQALRGFVIPAIYLPYFIFIPIYSRKLSKRIEALREEEGTATPEQLLQEAVGQPLSLIFIGSSLLVALGTTLVPIYTGRWGAALLMLLAACVWGALALAFAGTTPKRGVFAYAVGLGLTSLTCLGIYYYSQVQWREELENPMFWFLAGIQIQTLTFLLLVVHARRKVFGPGSGT
ncbi:MAG: sigma-70 family RNA polymerase sigma factor [Planctomycetota bacterium]